MKIGTRNIALLLILIAFFSNNSLSQNSFTVELARQFSKDIFESNGVPFLQPVVKVVNSTSNAGFYNDAFIPKKVNKPYFYFSVQMMYGLVPESEKSYTPKMPAEQFDQNVMTGYVAKYLQTGKIDTADIIHYFFLNLMYDGIYGSHAGIIDVPKSSPSALGNKKSVFELRKSALDTLVRSHPAFELIKQFGLQDTLLSAINSFPNAFDLPPGGNINHLIAGIPQLVIGSYYGTEMLLRWVPTLNLGSNIGKFNFWGIGLKHSISQYFQFPIDIAAQVVYQSTNLSNSVGVTNAKLNAEAGILNTNLQASYKVGKVLNIYSGISLDNINIKSTYKYSLPITMQWQLKLIDQFAKDEKGNYLSVDEFGNPNNSKPTAGFPGDQFPQTAVVNLKDNQFRFSLGISKNIKDFIISADYNFGKISVFNFSLGYKI
jgi:hypothetical protein